jgi:molybdenum cofactor cytidylyltransferase
VTEPERTVAAVLAAGRASRFGSDKLLYPFDGKPLAAHIAETLADLSFGARIAVCPAGAAPRAELFASRGYLVVDNPEPERGLSSSLALAAEYALTHGAEALLICLADMPKIPAEHIGSLVAAAADAEIVATEAAGVRSPPAVFSRASLPRLLALSGDRGARGLLEDAAVVAVAPELVRDIDRPEDLHPPP